MRPSVSINLDAVDASVAGAQNGDSIKTEFIFRFSCMTVATGAPVGTVKIQVSNDGSNWIDLPSATSAVSSATNYLIASTEICYQYLRSVYTKTSGTGTITTKIMILGA